MNLENTKVLVLDDEPVALELSRAAIASIIPEGNIVCSISAVETMRIIDTYPIDLVFIDIELADSNGFSVADYIRSVRPEIKYVFLTGHTELGAKSYDYEAFDFLSKPIDIMRLRKTFQRYQAQSMHQDNSTIAVNTSSGFVLLSPADICYISKEKRRTVIHCTDTTYTVQYSLDELETIFSDYDMFRVHQSFLAPLSRIMSVLGSDFGKTYRATLSDGRQVPVSRNQYSKLREHLAARGVRFM